jgi:hypothetical protein
VGKELDIFALRAVSLNHIFTQPKIVNNICSYSYCSVVVFDFLLCLSIM